jgi:hypothetical protein
MQHDSQFNGMMHSGLSYANVYNFDISTLTSVYL